MKGKTLLGIILVILGAGFLLDKLEVIELSKLIAVYWPAILIIIGASHLISRQKSSGTGITLILIGGFFQLRSLNLLPNNMGRYFFPTLLIIIGLFIIFSRSKSAGGATNDEDKISHFVLFSGLESKSISKAFRGGDITAIFGGIELDFRDSEISPEGALLDIISIFGGVKLKVPNHWKVISKGIPILGAYEDTTVTPIDGVSDSPALHIKYFTMFGGIEVSN